MPAKNIIYEATDYQKNLWQGHKLADQSAEAAEREGRSRYESFNGFADGIFHYFFADEPKRCEDLADGMDHFTKLDDQMQKIPEVADLREMTKTDDRRAGIAAASVIDTLMSTVAAPNDQVADPRMDEEAVDYLERLLARAEEDGDEELAEALEANLDEVLDGLDGKRDAAAQAADMMDETEVREAFRQAAQKAQEDIEKAEASAAGYGVGLDEHSGRKERRAVSAKLAALIANNERAQKIAEAGRRLQNFAAQEQRKKTRKGCGERTGSYMGAELEKMLPRELVYTHPKLRMLFARKYAERNLACVEKKDKEKKDRGPIVFLLDSSGSMSHDDRDVWAAGVALAFMSIARRQDRAFALIHFGSDVVRTDRFPTWKDMTPEAVFEAANFFASSGGTNFTKPLDQAVQEIRDGGAFEDADIVMVTDGQARVDDTWLETWTKAKEELGFNCYSIMVGDGTSARTNEKFSDDVCHLADAMRDDKAMHRFFGAV